MPPGDRSRELTQLISTAYFYLDLAERSRRRLSPSELDTSIQQHATNSSSSLCPIPLSEIDEYFAHIGSAAVRLATLYEFLCSDCRKQGMGIYPKKKKDEQITDDEIKRGIEEGIEVLLRDNVGHDEIGEEKDGIKPKFRDLALQKLTPSQISPRIQKRYADLAKRVAQHRPSSS
ncbi:MAG: hypothetical protein NTW68_11785 [candidate division NC10 bacterium]|nr:hypothetical protein [candidate division NC10 bacterium]